MCTDWCSILLDVEHARLESTDRATCRRAVFGARRKLFSLNNKSRIPAADRAIVQPAYWRVLSRLSSLLGPWLGTILKLELWIRPPCR